MAFFSFFQICSYHLPVCCLLTVRPYIGIMSCTAPPLLFLFISSSLFLSSLFLFLSPALPLLSLLKPQNKTLFLFAQVQPPPTEEHRQRVRSMIEALQTTAESCSPSPASSVLYPSHTHPLAPTHQLQLALLMHASLKYLNNLKCCKSCNTHTCS